MALTVSDYTNATNLAAGTATTANLPLFIDGDKVCCLEDYSTDFLIGAVGADTRKRVYTVRAGGAGHYDTSGSDIKDQTGVATTSTAGTPDSRVFAGFQHTTTAAATTGANTGSVGWGYTLIPDASEPNNFANTTKINLHQSRITTKAHMETFIAAQFSTIW